MKRSLLLVGGLGAFGFALAVMLGVSPVTPDPDRLVLPLVGLGALVQAYRVARARGGSVEAAETHDPERPVPVEPPGATIDRAVRNFLTHRPQSRHRPTMVQEGLRDAAVAVLVRFGGRDREDAEGSVERGTWTGDPFAADFVGGWNAPDPPLAARLRALSRGETGFGRGVAHTVDAILAGAQLRPDDRRGVEAALPDGEVRPARPPGAADGAAADGGATLAAEAGDAAGPTLPDDRPAAPGEAADDGTGDGSTTTVHDRRQTGHWKGVGSAALAGVGVGVLAGQPAVLLAGAVGLGFAAYARSAGPPDVRLSLSRSVDDDRPEPGDAVEVTVAVRNEGDRFAPDLRVVDGVPGALSVAEGSPRLGTALRPGETAEFGYAVTARRGVHAFDPAYVVARNVTGTDEVELLVDAPTELTCVPRLLATADPVGLRPRAARYAGRLETESGGEGLEFHATREYRPADPRSRIDWRRFARTGDLATKEFRREQAARVVVVVDARRTAYRAPAPDRPHAAERGVEAAGRLLAGLLDAGDRVGLAALAPTDCWLPPGAGTDHRARARRLLATHPAVSPLAPTTSTNPWLRLQRLRRRLSAGTQVVLCSPLLDEGAARVARKLEADGNPVTVVSPDPTAARTPAQRLARVARNLRLSELRSTGVRVVDWRWEESLDAALARAGERRRWSG